MTGRTKSMGHHYVLWGIGKRGKRMIDVLGFEFIEALIDTNPRYRNQTYMGKAFIDIETYKEKYSNLPIMVTPVENEDILKKLYKEGIWRYVFPEDIANF